MTKPRFQRREKEEKEFQEEVLQIDRVTRVVKGGRRLRFRATVIIGNKRGRVGVGVGKSNEVVGAIQKGINKAKKNIIQVLIYNDTIPHYVQKKFKSAKIRILPACAGTGLIAGGAVRKVLELAGIKNIIAKQLGSSNKINNARASINALKDLRELPGRKKDIEKMKEPEKFEAKKLTTEKNKSVSKPPASKASPKPVQSPSSKITTT